VNNGTRKKWVEAINEFITVRHTYSGRKEEKGKLIREE
jgi:hypothetical protein